MAVWKTGEKTAEKRLLIKIVWKSVKIYSFSVWGAGIAPVDLTTLSWLRACRTLKTEVKRKFFTQPSDPFVTSDVSDAQNCGETRILRLTMATLSWFRACRTLKTVVKRKLFTWPSDPFVTSDVSDAQNCGETRILRLTMATLSWFRACRTLKTVVKREFCGCGWQSSRHFVGVGRSKLW